MALGSLLKGLAHLSVCAWLFRAGCFGDVISFDEFRVLVWMWFGDSDCGPFQCIVPRRG